MSLGVLQEAKSNPSEEWLGLKNEWFMEHMLLQNQAAGNIYSPLHLHHLEVPGTR